MSERYEGPKLSINLRPDSIRNEWAALLDERGNTPHEQMSHGWQRDFARACSLLRLVREAEQRQRADEPVYLIQSSFDLMG